MSLAIDLTGRRALITGVSMGIGASMAKLLAQAGCDIAGCALEPIDSDEARRFIATVEAAGRRAYYERVDLSDPATPGHWVASAVKSLGGADILVSNAGRNFFEGAANCSEAAWLECMNVNLAAHWRLAKAAKPWLERGIDPVIIIIASIHAYATRPGSFPYSVAKEGVVALVRSLAIEWGPHIRTVGVAPGFIGTERYYAAIDSSPDVAASHVRREQLHPVGRIGRAEEIGALCAFLASSWSGFTSGSTFLVDGGLLGLTYSD